MVERMHRAEQHRSALLGVEAVSLVSGHAFPRHAHDAFGVGVMLSGAQRSWSGIGPVESEAGDAITVNPGEIHDGLPVAGQPRGWRMLYLDPALVAREVADDLPGKPEIAHPTLRDPVLTGLFARLFTEATAGAPDALAAEEALHRLLGYLLRRHGAGGPRTAARNSTPPVAQALRRLDSAPNHPASLAELAALSGVSRYQLLRGFAREVGTTPHAYQVQRRVRLARQSLAAGAAPAEAALRAGFADQSHMTRAFVRQLGVTPGRYQAAVA